MHLYPKADSLTKNPGPRFSKETGHFEIASPNPTNEFYDHSYKIARWGCWKLMHAKDMSHLTHALGL